MGSADADLAFRRDTQRTASKYLLSDIHGGRVHDTGLDPVRSRIGAHHVLAGYDGRTSLQCRAAGGNWWDRENENTQNPLQSFLLCTVGLDYECLLPSGNRF